MAPALARHDNRHRPAQPRGLAETALKTHHIELQRLKAATQGSGLVEFAIDAAISPRPPADDKAPTSVLSMSEANARVLLALIKAQLGEIDKRKARSQR